MSKKYLFFQKKSEKIVEYINLDENMYQLEIIGKLDKRYSSKHKYAFALSANGKSFEFYCKYQAQFQNWLIKLRKWCIMTNFNEVYKIGNILGAGGYGKVRFYSGIY